MTPETCPNCGADIPRHAKACPACGADETNWSEDAETGHLGLPDEEFDYGEFTKREFGDQSPKPRGIPWFWWAIGIVVLVAMLFLLL